MSWQESGLRLSRARDWSHGTFATVLGLAFLLAVSLILFRSALTPGFVQTGDFDFFPDFRKDFDSTFYPWSSQFMMGGDLFSLSLNPRGVLPYFLIWSLASDWLHIPAELVERIFILTTIVLCGLSAFLLLRELLKDEWPALVGAFFYLVNPVTLTRFPFHYWIFLGYSLIPLALLLLIRGVGSRNARQMGLCSLVSSAVLCATLATGMILLAIEFAIILVVLSTHKSGNRTKTLWPLVAFLVLVVLVNLFWAFFPLQGFLNPTAKGALGLNYLPGLYDYLYYNQSPIIALVRLATNQSDVASSLWYAIPGLILFLLGLPLALLVAPRSKLVISAAGLSLIGLLLSAGPVAPFPLGLVNIAVFVYAFPFSSLFRDASKFLIMCALSYAILFAVTSRWLAAHFSGLTSRSSRFLSFRGLAIVMIFLVVMAQASWPAFQSFGGRLQTFEIPSELQRVFDWLSSQPGDFRVWWLPVRTYAQYQWDGTIRLDVVRQWCPRPTIQWDANWSPLSVDLISLLQESWYPNWMNGYKGGNLTALPYTGIAKVLALLNVQYVIARYDVVFYPGEQEAMKAFLSRQDGLSLLWASQNYGIYVNSLNRAGVVRTYNEIGLVVGGFDFLVSSPDLTGLVNKKGLFFPQLNSKDAGLSLLPSVSDAVFVNNRSMLDLVMSTMGQRYLLPLSAKIGSHWGEINHLSRQVEEPVDFGSQTGLSTNHEDARLDIPVHIDSEAKYSLVGHVAFQPEAGLIEFGLAGAEYLLNAHRSAVLGYRWVEIAKNIHLGPGDLSLIMKNKSGLNFVSGLAIIPEQDLLSMDAEMKDTLDSNPIRIVVMTNAARASLSLGNSVSGAEYTSGIAIMAQPSHGLDIAINIPVSGRYAISALIRSSAGVVVSIDKQTEQELVPRCSIRSKRCSEPTMLPDEQYLAAGAHVLGFSSSGAVVLDTIYAWRQPSVSADTNGHTAVATESVPAYTRTDPVTVQVQTDRQFVVFLESFSEHWSLRAGDDPATLRPFVANAYANGFWKKTGYAIVLEHSQAKIAALTAAVSGMTFSVALVLCLIPGNLVRRKHLGRSGKTSQMPNQDGPVATTR